ncbi:MAG TPA: phosphate regulon sensor histidine kinase PhoR [Thioalkalivibrio sp.]|nr:phosphate regulon sensor histidine kinase PhoR [Thioalkalivibrio sp.]
MRVGITTEFWRLAGILALSLVLGLTFGQLGWALATGLGVVLFWQYRQQLRLLDWLRHGRRKEPPDLEGIAGEVVYDIYRQYQRDRRRKKKLAKVLNRFYESSSALPDATVILGPQGEIEWFNDAAKRLLGLRSGQDTGRRVGNLIRHPAFTAFLARGDYSEALEIPSPIDESLRLSVRVVPYGKNQRLLSARDVTRIARLEQMRRDFVGNVSHELRTPLTVITGYLEALTDGQDTDPGQVIASLKQMQSQAERMRRIVEDLLMLSRLETRDENGREDAEIPVPALLASIEEEARILSGDKGHVIQLEMDATLWLRGCSSELHSALSNLVSNAVRYTPPGGHIHIRWYRDEDGAHCAVTDTGIGIEPMHIPRLTERFYRVDTARSRVSGGTGLGLAIVKHVLRSHDATLRIESTPGEGSTFTADFPPERIILRPSAEAPGAVP